MWQDILTAVIVAVAALALLWRWLPQRWRARAARVHPAQLFTQPGGQPAPQHVSGGQRHDQAGNPLLPHHAPPPRAKVIR